MHRGVPGGRDRGLLSWTVGRAPTLEALGMAPEQHYGKGSQGISDHWVISLGPPGCWLCM